MSSKNSKNMTFIIILLLLIGFAFGYQVLKSNDTTPFYTQVTRKNR